MSQSGRDAGSESGENCDNFALFAPRDELPTIGGGVGAREQCSSHPNLPDTGNESEPEHEFDVTPPPPPTPTRNENCDESSHSISPPPPPAQTKDVKRALMKIDEIGRELEQIKGELDKTL